MMLTQPGLNLILWNDHWRERPSTIDLLEPTCLIMLLCINTTSLTFQVKQDSLERRSIVLRLPFLLVFPGYCLFLRYSSWLDISSSPSRSGRHRVQNRFRKAGTDPSSTGWPRLPPPRPPAGWCISAATPASFRRQGSRRRTLLWPSHSSRSQTGPDGEKVES